MMRNKLLILSLALVIGLTACGNEGASNDKEARTNINIPTAATTGALYPLGSSIATMWNNQVDGIKASAQASNGGIDNLNLLHSGDAQVSFAVTSVIHESLNGVGSFEGRANDKIRLISGLYYNPNQVIVRKDSGIDSLEDLVGKKFASGAPGSTTEVETDLHLTALGINYPDDLNAQFVGFTEASDLIRNKQLDGAWIMAGIPTAAVTEITTTADGRLIPIENELIDKLKVDYPWYSNYTIPANTYEGQDEDINTSAIKMAIFTSEDMDEDTIYELTKSFWENIDELKASNNSLKDLTVEDAVTDIADLPFHEGAIRYYKEIGVLD